MVLFKVLQYKFKQQVRMQSTKIIAIVHTMTGMRGMHKLYVRYLEHTSDLCSSIVIVTAGVKMVAVL